MLIEGRSLTAAFDIPQHWQGVLSKAVSTPQSHRLANVLQAAEQAGARIFPPQDLRFHALEAVSPDNVKAVILGQDPYHGSGQAHGLAFSVPDGLRPPPSLKNIFKELQRDLGFAPPFSGNLDVWAKQGVLLLNTVLTVEEAKAGSHQGKGWEDITDAVIKHAGRAAAQPTVFMMWGAHAQKKKSLIDTVRHLILEAPHPSPLSAHRGFIGCGHFSKANDWLVKNGREPIRW